VHVRAGWPARVLRLLAADRGSLPMCSPARSHRTVRSPPFSLGCGRANRPWPCCRI